MIDFAIRLQESDGLPLHSYSTAQLKLDIEVHVALECLHGSCACMPTNLLSKSSATRV